MSQRGIVERLDAHFALGELGTTVRTELLAGATTFLTMSYIVFVNPSILADAGMPPQAVMAATCLSAAFGCLLMGLWAKHPIALAPGMGINAYFAYGVVGGMGVPWQTALGAVFLSGMVFLVLTALGLRRRVLQALPRELYPAVAAGIGFFLALIGLRNAGIIVPNEATLVALGDLSSPPTLLAIVGLLTIATLLARKINAAMLVGILGVTVLGAGFGLVEWNPQQPAYAEMSAAAFELDIPGALSLGLLEIIFVFLFVDFFDTLGTIIAVTRRAGLLDERGEIPRVDRVLATDAAATVVGAVAGTSTVTSYIESAAGVAAGGRSGLTAVVAGILFLASLLLAPSVGLIPSAATAPALILVGATMMSSVREVDWDDVTTGVPAFLIVLTIPLTYSIANGLAIGFIAYDALKILRGHAAEVPWLLHVLAALFVLRFVYLAVN
jgi:AGZA family xanthine/uracil permease-like MFS transporter